jgi:hypothetical protein
MAFHGARTIHPIYQSASLFENALTWINDALHRPRLGWLLSLMP